MVTVTAHEHARTHRELRYDIRQRQKQVTAQTAKTNIDGIGKKEGIGTDSNQKIMKISNIDNRNEIQMISKIKKTSKMESRQIIYGSLTLFRRFQSQKTEQNRAEQTSNFKNSNF